MHTTNPFCAFSYIFWMFFCLEFPFCKHAKFSKVNAKFSKGVDFFQPSVAFFRQKQAQTSIFQSFSETFQNSLIFSQKFSRAEFSKFEGGGQLFIFGTKLTKNSKTTLVVHRSFGFVECARKVRRPPFGTF